MGDAGSIVRALRTAKSAVVQNAKQDLNSLRHLRSRAKDWWSNHHVRMESVRVEQPPPWENAQGDQFWTTKGHAQRCLSFLAEDLDRQGNGVYVNRRNAASALEDFVGSAMSDVAPEEKWDSAERAWQEHQDEAPLNNLEHACFDAMRKALEAQTRRLSGHELQHLRKQAEKLHGLLNTAKKPDRSDPEQQRINKIRTALRFITEACNESLALDHLPPHFLGPKRNKRKQREEYEKVKDRAIERALSNAVGKPGNALLKAMLSGEDPMPMVNKLSDGYRVFGEEKLLEGLCETFRHFRNAGAPQDYFSLKTAIDQMGRRAGALLEISKHEPMLRFKAKAMKTVHDAYYLATFPPEKRDLKGIPPLERPGVADHAWAAIRRTVGPKNPELTARLYRVIESVLLQNRNIIPIEELADLMDANDTGKIWNPLVAAFRVLPAQDVKDLRVLGHTLREMAQSDQAKDAPWRAKAQAVASVAIMTAEAHNMAQGLDVRPPETDSATYGPFCDQLIAKYAFASLYGSLDDVDKYVANLKGFVKLANRDEHALFAVVKEEYQSMSPSDRAILLEKIQTANAAIIGRSHLDYEIYDMSEKILATLGLHLDRARITDAPPVQNGVLSTDPVLGHARFDLPKRELETPELDQLFTELNSVDASNEATLRNGERIEAPPKERMDRQTRGASGMRTGPRRLPRRFKRKTDDAGGAPEKSQQESRQDTGAARGTSGIRFPRQGRAVQNSTAEIDKDLAQLKRGALKPIAKSDLRPEIEEALETLLKATQTRPSS